MRTVQLTANQRYLTLRCFEPEHPALATVVIAAALGVKQRFYQTFAEWLCEQGYRVITFDYYGIGASVDRPLKDINSNLFDWAQYDINAVLDYAHQSRNHEPLIYLAHSLGGQIVALADNARYIDRMVTVASGVGYWRQASPQVRRTSWLLWYLAVPLATPIAGYFPGKKLNMVGDMPAAAMRQWSHWCRSKNYLFDHLTPRQQQCYESFSAPITAFHISDDELLQRANIETLLQHYPSSDKRLHDLTPQLAHCPRIGHFNFFRPRFKNTLWQQQLLPQLKGDPIS